MSFIKLIVSRSNNIEKWGIQNICCALNIFNKKQEVYKEQVLTRTSYMKQQA